jgi:hypothetical protein
MSSAAQILCTPALILRGPAQFKSRPNIFKRKAAINIGWPALKWSSVAGNSGKAIIN